MSLISNIGKETNTYMQNKKTKKQLNYKLPDVGERKKEKKIHVQYLLCQWDHDFYLIRL